MRSGETGFQTENTHGTGCTFASAIATLLANGNTVPEAVSKGQDLYHPGHSESEFALEKGQDRPIHLPMFSGRWKDIASSRN